ncbi:MAG: glutathione S-transferase family protein [Pseudomonadota bacterium]
MNPLNPPVLRLHGYPVSNYYNVVRAALLEKEIPFELVAARASQEPGFLAHSPMGKIPVLETPAGWLGETVAILEYLEDTQGGPRLHPADAFMRARGRQVVNIVQMYVEAPVRSLFPSVFFGLPESAELIESVRRMLERASGALTRLGVPGRLMLGDELSYADLFAFYCFDIADRVTRFVYDRSIVGDTPGLAAWFARMLERESTRLVLADFEPAFAGYLVEKNSPYLHGRQKCAT